MRGTLQRLLKGMQELTGRPVKSMAFWLFSLLSVPFWCYSVLQPDNGKETQKPNDLTMENKVLLSIVKSLNGVSELELIKLVNYWVHCKKHCQSGIPCFY